MFSHKGFYRPFKLSKLRPLILSRQDIKISFTVNSPGDQLGRVLTGSLEILKMTN